MGFIVVEEVESSQHLYLVVSARGTASNPVHAIDKPDVPGPGDKRLDDYRARSERVLVLLLG